jgi:hypothetical protein
MRQTSIIRQNQRQDRNRRDFIVMHRMFLNTLMLCIVTVPYLIIYTYDAIRDRFDSLIYRVQWL